MIVQSAMVGLHAQAWLAMAQLWPWAAADFWMRCYRR